MARQKGPGVDDPNTSFETEMTCAACELGCCEEHNDTHDHPDDGLGDLTNLPIRNALGVMSGVAVDALARVFANADQNVKAVVSDLSLVTLNDHPHDDDRENSYETFFFSLEHENGEKTADDR